MENKFTGLPDISTIQPDRLIKYRISEDRFSAEVLLPGFAYTDFDQKIGGKLHYWSISKLTEAARWQALKHGFAYFPEMLKEGKYLTFIASQVFEMSNALHNLRYKNVFGWNFPLKFYLSVCDVGKTSFCNSIQWVHSETGEELGLFITKVVYVDMTSRKPTAVPEQLLMGLEQHLRNVQRRVIPKPVPTVLPDHVFTYEVKALHSDIDKNGHVNQATYLTWCSDGASMAAKKQKLKNFNRHIELYPCSKLEVNYVGEALVNDVVSVKIWEDERSNRVLHVAILCKGKIICVVKLSFYEDDLAEVSPHLESQL